MNELLSTNKPVDEFIFTVPSLPSNKPTLLILLILRVRVAYEVVQNSTETVFDVVSESTLKISDSPNPSAAISPLFNSLTVYVFRKK